MSGASLWPVTFLTSAAGEIVVLDKTSDGVFHGHVRSWEGLDQAMRNALIKGGMFNRRGKYIGGN